LSRGRAGRAPRITRKRPLLLQARYGWDDAVLLRTAREACCIEACLSSDLAATGPSALTMVATSSVRRLVPILSKTAASWLRTVLPDNAARAAASPTETRAGSTP